MQSRYNERSKKMAQGRYSEVMRRRLHILEGNGRNKDSKGVVTKLRRKIRLQEAREAK